MIDLSQFAVTLPGWLTLTLAVLATLLSLQIIGWYIAAVDPYPFFPFQLPKIALKDREDSEK